MNFIKVRVLPSSKKEDIVKKSSDSFQVSVKEKPEHGLANKKTRELLAKYLKISPNKLKMVRGAKTRNKIFQIYE